MPEVKTGIGPGCTRWLRDVSSTTSAGGGCCFKLSFLRLRRALVDAYVFSVFYWPVTAADVRGGAEKGAEGRGRGVLLYRWGGGGRLFFLFFSVTAGDGLSLPARRQTQARGAGHGPENRVRAEWRIRLDLSLISSERSAVVHLRWLPLDFSDIVTEMGNIIQFMGSARDAD